MAKSGSGGWSKRRTTSRSNAGKSWNQRTTFTTNTNKGQTRSTSVGSGSKGNRTRTTISTNLSIGKTKRIMTVTTGMGTKRINMSPTPKPMKTMKVRKSKAKAWKPKRFSRSRRYTSSNYSYTPRAEYTGDGSAFLSVLKYGAILYAFLLIASYSFLLAFFVVVAGIVWWLYSDPEPVKQETVEHINEDIKQQTQCLKEVDEAYINKSASDQDPNPDLTKDENGL